MTSRPFAVLASNLKVRDTKPDLSSIEPIVNAAFAAVDHAEVESQRTPDCRTTIDVTNAMRLMLRTRERLHGRDTYGVELDAVGAIELASSAIRRSLEIRAGLCQPLTEDQLNGRAAVTQGVTHLSEADRRRSKAWIAAWRALPRFNPPVGRKLERRTAEVNAQLNLLWDRFGVPEDLRRWLDGRKEDLRNLELHKPAAGRAGP